MFFQEATPDTSGYMIAGYVATFLIMGLYIVSMYLRSRNLNRDMSTLEELDRAAPPVQTPPVSSLQQSPARSGNSRSPKAVTKKARKK